MKRSLVFVAMSLLAWLAPRLPAQELLPPLEVTAPPRPSRSSTAPPTAATPRTVTSSVATPPAPVIPPAPLTPTFTPPAAPPAMPCAMPQMVGACRQGTPIVGAAMYILSPYFDGNPAFTTTTGIGSNAPNQSTTDFTWNYNLTPAVWLGWLNENGWGVRGHYFFYDQRSRVATASLNPDQALTSSIVPPANLASPAGSPSFGSPGVILGNGLGQDNLAFDSTLRIHAADVEACQLVTGYGLFALISGGGRYLNMSQSYRATLNNQASGATELQQLQFTHDFNGGGPTLDLVAGYQLGERPVFLFGDIRGSFLVGGSRSARNFILNVNDPNNAVGGNQFANPTADARRSVTLPIIELELGVQIAPVLMSRPLHIRAGAVHQTYFGAGSASQASGNLSLFGGQVSAGFLY